MMIQKRLTALFLVLALGLPLLPGCGAVGGSASSSAAGSGAASAAGSSSAASSSQALEIVPMDLTGVTDPYLATAGLAADTIVATAGGFEVTAASLLYWLNYGIESYLSQYGASLLTEPLPWELQTEGGTFADLMLASALETAAFRRLLPEVAAQEGIFLTQEELDGLDSQIELAAADLGGQEQFTYFMWHRMSTPEGFLVLCQDGLLYQKLQDLYYGEGSEGYPTDAEVNAYAQDVRGDYRAKHILLLTKDMSRQVTLEDGSTGFVPLEDEVIAQKEVLARQLAEELAQADDPVALFDELMHRHSEDSGLAANPDGYTTTKGYMVPQFEQAALALQVGEISDVVESSYGYHIILRLPLELESYRSELVAQEMDQRVAQWMEEYGLQTTQAYGQIDPAQFQAQSAALKAAVEQLLQAAQEEQSASSGS